MTQANVQAYGSIVLSVLDVAGLWLLAHTHRSGWMLLMITNTLWIPYIWLTRQPGFFLLVGAYYWVSADGWNNWNEF